MIQPGEPASAPKVEARPKDVRSLSPGLTCGDAAREIEFLKQALGARELFRLDDPDSQQVLHAELSIGDSTFMLGDAVPGLGKTAKNLGGSAVAFYLYVPDVDAVLARAAFGGAKVTDPAEEMFWGDRVGTFECPEGFRWSIATHTRDLTSDEIKQAFHELKRHTVDAKT